MYIRNRISIKHIVEQMRCERRRSHIFSENWASKQELGLSLSVHSHASADYLAAMRVRWSWPLAGV
jgi:hypothetical protein